MYRESGERNEEGRGGKGSAVRIKSVQSIPHFFGVELKGLTFLGDSYLFPEIAHCDERYDACCDNDLLHAGGDGGIKDTRGTRHGTLEKELFFWSLDNMKLNLGTGTTHIEDGLRGG